MSKFLYQVPSASETFASQSLEVRRLLSWQPLYLRKRSSIYALHGICTNVNHCCVRVFWDHLVFHWAHPPVGENPLDDQLESFLTYLCDGSSSKLNGIIVDKVCGTFHDSALLGKSSVKWEPTGFITSYHGSKQKVEQTFKSLKAASDWLVQLDNAEKDYGLCG